MPALQHRTLAVALGDVDGVNGPDIFLVGIGQNRLLINDGSGNFADETNARLPAATDIGMDIELADVDGDGDFDAVIANKGSRNQIWINDGSGNFSDQSAARLATDADPTYAVVTGDVNGDGAPDIFFSNFNRQNRLFTNNLLGSFGDATASLPVAQAATGDAVLIDVDADGDLDIATADGTSGVGLLLNDGTGLFTEAAAGAVPAVNTFGVTLGAGDIDFDGSIDLVLGSLGQDVVLLNDGAGIFTDTTAIDLPADDRRSFGVLLADADQDLDLDLLVATPQGQNRYFDNAIAAPRVITVISPDYIEVTDTVSISVTAFDEDGVVSTTVEIVQPDTTIVPPNDLGGGAYSFVPDASQVGTHIVRVTSEDSLGNIAIRETSFLAQQNDVTLPVIDTFTVTPLSLTQGENVSFEVAASDDRGVVSLTLTVGGVNVPLNASGQAVYAPTSACSLAVIVEASDAAGNVAVDSQALSVAPDTEDPVVLLSALPDPVDITNAISISSSATDNIIVASFEVRVTGPPGGPVDELVPLNSGGNADFTPFIPGTYLFTATASDPAGNVAIANASVEAIGIPDVEAPVVSLSVVPGTTVVGGTVTITVNATDNIFVLSRTLEVNGAPLVLDGLNQAQFTAPLQGSYTAVATATDPTGNTGSDTVVFSAVDPATDLDFPVVEITSPTDDAELTTVTEFTGTATDLTLVSYELSYAEIGTGAYSVFHTGTTAVEGGVLGTLDTSLLQNGVYEVRLEAIDINGRSSATDVVLNVAGELKLGQFTVSFLDKALNIGRFPLDVTRFYDSRRRAEVGDFGHGWNIDSSSSVAMENRSPGLNWRLDVDNSGFFPQYTLVGTRPHTVTIRFSEEDEVRFSARPNPYQQTLYPIQLLNGMDYQPIGNAEGSLSVNEHPDLFLSGQLYDFNFETYNPSTFTYNSDDGYAYRFTETNSGSLRHELSSITDPNGTTVTFGNGGFSRSDGLGLTFVRDGQNRITQITDPNGNTVQYSYDAAGDLVAVTDGAGNATTFLYDANHFLTEIRDPSGTPLQRQEYDEDGRLIAMTDGEGNRVEMEYDVDANTQIIRDRRGNPTIYEYDSRGNVERETGLPLVDGVTTPVEVNRTFNVDNEVLTETDGAGVTTNFAYDSAGRRLSTTRDVGGLNLVESFTYDSAGRVLTHTDPRGGTVTHTYSSQGNKVTTTDRTGAVTAWEYDTSGNVTRQTDALGNYTLFTYGGTGARLSEELYDVSDVLQRRKTFTHDANGNMLTETMFATIGGTLTPLTTTFTYDGNDQVLATTDPNGNTSTKEYDALNRLVAEIDGAGARTEYTYNDIDEVVRTDHPDGTSNLYGFDADGNRISETNRNGDTTTFTYDALDRLTFITFADGEQREKRYDLVGNVIGEIDEAGTRTDHEYDAVSRRVRTLQPDVFDAVAGANARPETLYEYDANSNQIAVVDHYTRRTEQTYDGEDRLTGTLFADGTSTSVFYDPIGNELARTDAAGNTTEYDYDPLARLVGVSLPSPDGIAPRPETAYAYDEAGRLVAQTDAIGRVTEFEYDLVGNRVARVLPGGESETFTYDAVNRIVTRTDFNGDLTTFTYDAVGRETSRAYADGTSVVTTVNGEGFPLTIVDARGTTTYAYDSRSRLLSKAGPDGTVTYAYNAIGKQALVSSASGGTAYVYDSLQRLSAVTDPGADVTTYEYDAVGNLVATNYANGAVTTNAYNSRYQLTSVDNRRSDTSVIASYAYTLNANGLRTSVTEADGGVVSYAYDNNYRLVDETRTGLNAFVATYTYDAVGNRLTANRSGVITNYTYDDNDRLIGENLITYTYDPNGNRTRKTDGGGVVTTYTYDKVNRLVAVGTPSTTTARYVYDAAGNKVQEQDGAGAVVRNFVVDVISVSGVAQVIEERSAADVLEARYSHGHDLVSQHRGLDSAYYHYDGTGSTRVLTYALGASTDTYLYDAYGVELASSGATANRYRFAGEQFDVNSGFYYLRARFYDPATGVFVSTDSFAGDPQSPLSLHRYLYAFNNPVNFSDPSGKFSLISVSISISISTSIRSIYTTNLIKFFFKAAKICYCQLAPAYDMQAMALDMIMRGLPGGFKLLEQSRKNIAGAFQAIGREIIQTYQNIASDIVSVKLEIGTDLDDLYDDLVSNSPYPNSGEIQKLLNFKSQLDEWLGRYNDAMLLTDSISIGDACGAFTALDNQADFITGLIPSF